MSWASRRRNLYLVTFGTISLVTLTLLAVLVFYRAPTCSDGKQNGSETGVDCGGSCKLLCTAEVRPPIVHWSRSFEIKPGLWSALALVENPNRTAAAREASYIFKLFDADNVLVAIREGATMLPAGSITPVFYANITTGTRIPTRTFFEWNGTPVFERAEHTDAAVVVGELSVSGEGTLPRVEARLTNTSGRDLPSLIVTAIVFNTEGNAIAASQTVTPPLPRDRSDTIIFTWPSRWPSPSSRVEIFPVVSLP